jgi:hypothetical protein
MSKPVGMTCTDNGCVIVVLDDGSVYATDGIKIGETGVIGKWVEVEPVPNTVRSTNPGAPKFIS